MSRRRPSGHVSHRPRMLFWSLDLFMSWELKYQISDLITLDVFPNFLNLDSQDPEPDEEDEEEKKKKKKDGAAGKDAGKDAKKKEDKK